MGDLVNKMGAMLGDVNARLDEQEKFTAEIKTNLEGVTDELRKGIRMLTDNANAYRTLVKFAKEHAHLTDKELEDTEEIRDNLRKMVDLHKVALRTAKEGSKEYKQMSDNLGRAENLLSKITGKTKLATEEAKELNDLYSDAAKNIAAMDKALGNLTRHGAALKGLGGILSAFGIQGGRQIERKIQQVGDIREAVKASRELRGKAVLKHMTQKRERAMEEGSKMGYTFGDDAEGAKGRGWLAKKMGFERGSPKYEAFAKGELSIAQGKDAGAAYRGVMSEGGGGIEAFMQTFESGIDGLMGAMEGLAVPLMAVAGVVMLLVAVFDTYAKQNQEIEKNLGKAGLFTQPGVGAGDAFMAARIAMNPNLSARGVALGSTFERNMGMAAAMAGAGYNVADTFTGPDIANAEPGAGGAFMRGSLGEFQRTIMGVSRVAGLTDEEGAANLIKLLQEYRQTMASSEEFMNRLNKDTQAAGISTTKYLKIIDEVSGHFDKMGKSLEQVTGVMRELSRYGAVSGESLKDMMDFLTQGPTTEGNLPQNIFSQMMTPTPLLESSRKGEAAAVQDAVENANMELKRLGLGEIDSRGMTPDQIRAAVGQKRQDIMGLKNAADQQTATDALKRVTDQLLHQRTVGGGAMTRGAGAMLFGEDLIQRSQNNFSKLDTVTSQFGASVDDLIKGNVSAQQMIGIKKLSSTLDFDPIKAIGLLQQESQNRIREATTTEDPKQRKEFIKQLLIEIKRKGGLPTTLKGSQWEGFTGGLDDLAESMAKNGKDASDALAKNADTIAGTVETQTAITDKMRVQQRAGTLQEKASLDQAADIGKNTQTVEDILKNIFKPLLTDLLFAIEFIARGVAKFTGQSFDLNKKQSKEDIGRIPAAMSDLSNKTKTLMDANTELQKKKEAHDGKLSDADQKMFDDNKAAIEKNVKTMQYLNDTLTVGVKTGTEQDALEQTLKGLHGYIKEGKAAVEAPTAKDLEPGFWKKAGDTALAGMGPGGWMIKALASSIKDALQSSGGTTNYYNAESTSTYAQPDNPNTSGEQAGPTVQK